MKLSKVNAAYIAGLIDGEGSIGYYRTSNGLNRFGGITVRVKVAMTDPRPIFWLQTVTGLGRVSYAASKVQRLPLHTWEIKKKSDVVVFLSAIVKHLKVKQEQASLLIKFLDEEVPIPRRAVKPEVQIRRTAMLNARDHLEQRLKELKVPPVVH